MAKAGSGAPANENLNRNATIWGPRWPGAGSGGPANKNFNRNATIWGPRWPGAGSGARAIRVLIEMVPFANTLGQERFRRKH